MRNISTYRPPDPFAHAKRPFGTDAAADPGTGCTTTQGVLGRLHPLDAEKLLSEPRSDRSAPGGRSERNGQHPALWKSRTRRPAVQVDSDDMSPGLKRQITWGQKWNPRVYMSQRFGIPGCLFVLEGLGLIRFRKEQDTLWNKGESGKPPCLWMFVEEHAPSRGHATLCLSTPPPIAHLVSSGASPLHGFMYGICREKPGIVFVFGLHGESYVVRKHGLCLINP